MLTSRVSGHAIARSAHRRDARRNDHGGQCQRRRRADLRGSSPARGGEELACPTAAIVTIGDEIVEGRVLNEIATWLSDELMTRGVWPRVAVAVSDVVP